MEDDTILASVTNTVVCCVSATASAPTTFVANVVVGRIESADIEELEAGH
jgi:hypothetical protein